jgi:ubiquinone/menaquinone biosynthesis C-methylase UbiE
VLDLGVGTGRITRRVRRLGARVVAGDAAPGMLIEARRTTSGVPLAQLRVGDPLPFAANRFDAVVSFRVLKYVANWVDAAREVHRVLQPGGHAVLEFTNRRSLARFGYPAGLVHAVSVREAVAGLQSAGLEPIAIDAGTRLPFRTWAWATSAARARPLRWCERLLSRLAPTAGARSIVVTCRRGAAA